MKSTNLFKIILGYFLRGLLFITPVALTGYAIYSTVLFADNMFPFKIPGLGFLVTLAAITLVGLIGSSIIARPLLGLIDDLISKAPVIRILYTSLKEFMEAFVGQKKKFTEPVLVKIYEGTGLMKMGFVTDRDLSRIGLGEDYVAVYFPHSYNFSGNLFFVPSKNIIPVEGSPTELMKYIVTAGVTSLNEPKGGQTE
jgi:uncharacterized membrane protein